MVAVVGEEVVGGSLELLRSLSDDLFKFFFGSKRKTLENL